MMADDDSASAPPLRLVNFVSQDELDHAKSTRGERVEDGTAQRDRPLYEILRENKERKDAEFNERFKHRPPKALDEDETEFLDKLEMSRKEYEQQVAFEENQELRGFHEAVAARAAIVHELKETPTVSGNEEHKPGKKSQNPRPPPNFIIAVRPQSKKAKTDVKTEISPDEAKSSNGQVDEKIQNVSGSALGGLVGYGDDSEDDD